jgi:hypothetical protein
LVQRADNGLYNTAINLHVPWMLANLLTGWRTVNVSRRMLAPCNGSDSEFPDYNSGDPRQIPGQPVREFWWTKWHWQRLNSELCEVPLSATFHQWSTSRD